MVTRTRPELVCLDLEAALNRRDRTLQADDTVASALDLFATARIQVLPILDDRRYVGSVDRAQLVGVDPSTQLGVIAHGVLPTVRVSVSVEDALAQLDADGGRRLVVLEEDGVTYRGLVCLRSDRVRLCVDVECAADRG